MWRAYNQDGTLTYSFVESLQASYPGYLVRLIGGTLFFAGMLVMAWNLWMTARQAAPAGEGSSGAEDGHHADHDGAAGDAGSGAGAGVGAGAGAGAGADAGAGAGLPQSAPAKA